MSASEILKFIMDADCYPNVSIAYRILLTVPVTVASAERSFSIEVVEKLFEITYVTRKVKLLGYVHYREGVLDDFALRNARRQIFS
jgi:hypothetical protein